MIIQRIFFNEFYEFNHVFRTLVRDFSLNKFIKGCSYPLSFITTYRYKKFFGIFYINRIAFQKLRINYFKNIAAESFGEDEKRKVIMCNSTFTTQEISASMCAF